MADKEIERKIAVIFATDVVGYSKSVEVNEEQTIKNFRACKKILEDLFKEHDGRVFNTAGDSVLAKFHFDKQKTMKNSITKWWIENFYFVNTKPKEFMNDYIKVLQSLGLPDQ